MRAALITVSTSRAAGDRDDESGERLAEFARSIGADIAGREVVPDGREAILTSLCRWADDDDCELVLTSGGTGLGPTDVTPEATREAIQRDAPGIAEAMRLASREHTPHWMLSRGVAGVRGRTLIINFPGSPKSIAEAGEAIRGALPHALALISGVTDHG